MSDKEAKARIKINRLLEESGWRFFDDENGYANIRLEPNVKIKQSDIDAMGDDFEKTDSDLLAQYINRISSILKDSVQDKKDSIASLESLTNSVNELTQENVSLKRQLIALSKFESVDEFTRTIILDKVANIITGSNSASIHEFLNYLDIYSAYSDKNKAAK